MAKGYVYAVNMAGVAVATAITIIQIKAGNAPIDILRVWIGQSNFPSAAMQRLQINRKSAAATVTSFTPVPHNPADPASLAVGGTAATGITATAEGTDTTVLFVADFHIYNGFERIWNPDERIRVPLGAIIGLKFPSAPTNSVTIDAGIEYEEVV